MTRMTGVMVMVVAVMMERVKCDEDVEDVEDDERW